MPRAEVSVGFWRADLIHFFLELIVFRVILKQRYSQPNYSFSFSFFFSFPFLAISGRLYKCLPLGRRKQLVLQIIATKIQNLALHDQTSVGWHN
jgi:hypothetical protein